MDDKENPHYNTGTVADNNGLQTLEEATSAMNLWSSSLGIDQSPAEATGRFSRPYSNSHHAHVRRSSDDREEGLLHESEHSHEKQGCPYLDSMKEPVLIHPVGLENLDELPMRTHSQPDERSRFRNRFAQPIRGTSLQISTSSQQQDKNIPQQEICGQRCEFVSTTRRPSGVGIQGLSDDPETSPGSRKLCFLFLFKRGIIARDDLCHALYIIPVDDFQKRFPKIKQYEAVVCHATEFPMAEEKLMKPNSLFHRVWIDGICKIQFEIVGGENFSIVSPSEIIANVTEILSRSKDRVGCGFSADVLTRCTGGKDKLFEDNIRIGIQSGSQSFHFMLPIAYYEANISPWLFNAHAVTLMPDEDREVLRSCHVSLLENIGNPISVCDHLYQHKIFDSGDLEEIQNITRKRDRNAFLLRTIKTRGNILDLVIEIMKSQRENQGAAAILQEKRH